VWFIVAFRWRLLLRRSGWPALARHRAITANRLGLHAFAIFDADRFLFDILDAYASEIQAFYQLRCCRLALSRLGCFIKS
jgi:hypothetical protein